MGRALSFFNPYSQGENQVTNYCGLMLKLLYKESPEAFEQTINDLISDTGKVFESLPEFSQQVKKSTSIPDLCFSQKSFEIYFETKNTDWFYNDQIKRHIDGFEAKKTDSRILFLLTKEFDSNEDKIKEGISYAMEKGVILRKITFENFLSTIKKLLLENEFELSKYFREYLKEFEEYLSLNNYLDSWQNLLDVVNCGGTKEEIYQNYYLCPNIKTYSHRRAKYFGAYWWKNVNYISLIKARIIIANGQYTLAWKNTQESDESFFEIAKEIVKNCSDSRKEEIENNEMQLFLLDKLVELDFKKVSHGGMFSSKRYFSVKAHTIEELYLELNDKTWE